MLTLCIENRCCKYKKLNRCQNNNKKNRTIEISGSNKDRTHGLTGFPRLAIILNNSPVVNLVITIFNNHRTQVNIQQTQKDQVTKM